MIINPHDSWDLNRRDFIKTVALGSTAMAMSGPDSEPVPASTPSQPVVSASQNLNLAPAQWLWYPSGRCLPNTFVLFRKTFHVSEALRQAYGWILADSRYQLFLDGRRVQWGPVPADPRWPEADPLELTALLTPGWHTLGVQVLFYGHGDGTWPIGKPGLLLLLNLADQLGQKQQICTDATWRAFLAKSWPPGQYKRWYLRSLQEVFDARLFPHDWCQNDFQPGPDWLPAMVLAGGADKPALNTNSPEYLMELNRGKDYFAIRPRSVPFMTEPEVPVARLVESYWLDWQRPPEEYFDFVVPDAFRAEATSAPESPVPGTWHFELPANRALALTFELTEQVVGWPYFTIDAPAGTIVELLVHEAHQPGGPVLINSHFHAWTRFICRDGVNEFLTFDFESLRWLQLHLRGQGQVKISRIGVRRRLFPWPAQPQIRTDEPGLQRLWDACVNTLNNSAQETLVDGMARERQQYSGDGGHQMHGVIYAFGETRLPARYITTFSQGMTLDGYFLDCWPAYDRLARLMERQLHLTEWGPILDHGIGFGFDCWHYYMYTGDRTPLQEAYPRLLRFRDYLASIVRADRLLPVEDTGIPSVWLDHQAYRQQRHKRCAFNLYAAAMLMQALPALSRVMDDEANATKSHRLGQSLLQATVRTFWSRRHGLFINNQPWLGEENGIRTCDRSLATAILFDQCPGQQVNPALQMLVECPPEMGFSYPANAGWRLWALAKGGRTDVIVKELRQRWAKMDSVVLNNTVQEDWQVQPDSGSQWSHCAVVPLYVLYMSLAGIQPLEPGFRRIRLRPQFADLENLSFSAHTVRGEIAFTVEKQSSGHELTVTIPTACDAELVVPESCELPYPTVAVTTWPGTRAFALAGGATYRFRIEGKL